MSAHRSHSALSGLYVGRSCFLLCGGPSFGRLDAARRERLRRPGVLTMAVNNAAAGLRPNLWVGVDPPHHFLRSVWLDPTILKFCPQHYAEVRVFDGDAWRWTETRVRECPGVFFFDVMGEAAGAAAEGGQCPPYVDPARFLTSEALMWGEADVAGPNGTQRDAGRPTLPRPLPKREGSANVLPGRRSVMLPALRILFDLGVRRVFLLGCDFRMGAGKPYHFDQSRSRGSLRGNLHTYAALSAWFGELRPIFEASGFHVFNCNPDSALKAFDFIDFDDAMRLVMEEFGNIDVSRERTEGLYDRPKPALYETDREVPAVLERAAPSAAEHAGG